MAGLKKTNILIITKSSWVDTNANGNTLSNFFDNWNNVEFYNLFLMEELPQNNICKSYFQITEKQFIKYFFKSNKIGFDFCTKDIEVLKKKNEVYKAVKAEKNILNFFRKRNSKIFNIVREILWKFGTRNKTLLNEFLDKKEIDIIFGFAADPIYLQELIIYCKIRTKAKLILFFADDIYNFQSNYPFELLYRKWLQQIIHNSVKLSDKLYGASEKLCHEYEKYFGKTIEPLYKGCFLDETKQDKLINTPIKIVYAGNLYYGRWKILEFLAEEIVKINKDAVRVILDIYTTASITPELYAALNRVESSNLMGALPYEGIKNVLKKADIVLHVESFEPKQVKITRLSFSTKIIDCMQSGSCMMAIGPGDVASIQYLEKIEGAIVIKDKLQIKEVLNEILENPEKIELNAISLQKYAIENHEINDVQSKLKKDFIMIMKNK